MWRFLRNRRLILRLHYYLGTHILGASRGGPCDSTALVCVRTVDIPSKNEQRFLRHTIQHQIYAPPHFIVSNVSCLWPHNSPDLIPVDTKVCGVMQERVYRRPILDVADLNWHLTVAWPGLQQHVIDERRGRLCPCVRTDGRHFKHLL